MALIQMIIWIIKKRCDAICWWRQSSEDACRVVMGTADQTEPAIWSSGKSQTGPEEQKNIDQSISRYINQSINRSIFLDIAVFYISSTASLFYLKWEEAAKRNKIIYKEMIYPWILQKKKTARTNKVTWKIQICLHALWWDPPVPATNPQRNPRTAPPSRAPSPVATPGPQAVYSRGPAAVPGSRDSLDPAPAWGIAHVPVS